MKRVGWGLLLAAVSGVGVASQARAAEEYERFLNELRARGHYEMALFYLDQMRASPLISPEQQQMIEYEEARTNLEASQKERDPVKREAVLDGASQKFKDFVAKNPNHPQAAGAGTQLGAVLVERGRAKVEQASRPEYEKEKQALLDAARKYFDEAEAVFLAAETRFKEEVEKYPKFLAQNEPNWALRERAKGDLIQARMFNAFCVYEKSRTYPEKSKERTDALKRAAETYGNVYKEYRTLIAGLSARLKEGECYQELGDIKRALGLYNDLLAQPDELKPLRPYKASALYLSLQCWTDDSEKLYELATIQADEFLKSSSTDELSKPEWLAVRYYGALAHKKFAESFPADAPPDDVKKKERSLDTATDYANIVASVTNEYQDLARDLMKTVGADAGAAGRGPRSFLEAQNRGLQEMEKYTAAYAAVTNAAAQLGATDPNDQAAYAAAQEAYSTARKTAQPLGDEALKYFNMALSLADDNTTLDDKNAVRYYICYISFSMERFYDAAVIGEFLLQHYPNSGGARDSAKIALASFVSQYQRNQEYAASDDPRVRAMVVNPEVDRDKMYELAGKIAERWKGSPEADAAWDTILSVAVNERDLANIRRALPNIQETSELRSPAEMKAGATMWFIYNDNLVLDAGAPGKMSAEEMQKLAEEVNQILKAAVERQRPVFDKPEKLNVVMFESVVFLCDSFIALGNNAEALKYVEDPQVGLLAAYEVGKAKLVPVDPNAPADPAGLISAGMPATTAFEAVKLAVQAYVLNNNAAKAEEKSAFLTDITNSKTLSDETAGQLGGMYLTLAVKLDKQIAGYRETGDTAGIKKTVPGIKFFLDKSVAAYPLASADPATPLPKDTADANFANVNWVSDNFYRLGGDLLGIKDTAPKEGDDPTEHWVRSLVENPYAIDVTKQDEEATALLQRSIELDTQLMAVAPTPDDAFFIVMRRARAMRRAGNYDGALDEFARLLEGDPNMMDIQAEAAETLRDKARATQSIAVYRESINGTRPNAMTGEMTIWGWHRLADSMRQQESFLPLAPATPANLEDPAVKAAYDEKMKTYETDLAAAEANAPGQHRYIHNIFHLGRFREALCYLEMADLPGNPERPKNLNAVTYIINGTRGYDPSVGATIWDQWPVKYKELESKVQAGNTAAGG